MNRVYFVYDARAIEGGARAATTLANAPSLEDARILAQDYGGGVVYSYAVHQNEERDGDRILLSEPVFSDERFEEVVSRAEEII